MTMRMMRATMTGQNQNDKRLDATSVLRGKKTRLAVVYLKRLVFHTW
jgi:hypothetical protein